MMQNAWLWVHPIFAVCLIGGTFFVAFLGWRSRLTHRPSIAVTHVKRGKLLLIALVIVWVLGVVGVMVANVPTIPPANSGHFVTGTIIVLGYSLSAAMMLRWRNKRWVRIFHPLLNTLLLVLVAQQLLLGVNRLYKFGLLSPVPQDPTIRSLLAIKFGLGSPPVTAMSGQSYRWSKLADGNVVAGQWREDGDTLLQTSTADAFPLFIFNEPVFADFQYSTDFKIESGQADQYAALAFRIVDERNYYVVRASASEQSVTFARFDNGVRSVLQTFPVKVALGQWQALEVEANGTSVKITLNGQPVAEVSDANWGTGRLGLGTKADSVARFRNIKAVEK